MSAGLSRRERQIMDVLYRAGRPATARDVERGLPDAPSYSAVRALLKILEEKGEVIRHAEGRAHRYEPSRPREAAASSALRRVVETFFGGSVPGAVTGLLGLEDANLSREELDRIAKLIREKRKP